MDPNKLYSKTELFRKHYSQLKKYVRAHGLPIERGVSRAKLARQLVEAGIYKKPKSEMESEAMKCDVSHFSPKAAKTFATLIGAYACDELGWLKGNEIFAMITSYLTDPNKLDSDAHAVDVSAMDKNEKSKTEAMEKQRQKKKLLLFKLLDIIIFKRNALKRKRRFCAKGKARSTNNLLKVDDKPRSNSERRASRKRGRKIRPQSPRYQRKSKQSFELDDDTSTSKRSAARSISREVPGTPPPSLGLSKRGSSNISRGGTEVPDTPETFCSEWSFSSSVVSELSHSEAWFSRSGSNRSIGGGHITDKRTPESSLSIFFSFSGADTDTLPSSGTMLKRDPSNSSKISIESDSLIHARSESSERSNGENPISRGRLHSGRDTKQRDSITLNVSQSMEQVAQRNTKKTPKGKKKRLKDTSRNTRKGRRRPKRKKKQKNLKKRLADLNATGERSSHEIFGDEFDGWPDVPPRANGERNTIHVDPLTPRKVRLSQTLPDTTGINRIKAQLSEDMKGKDMSIESVKMYLNPLLSTGGLKRLLSDEESLFIQEINSQRSVSDHNKNVSDGMASLFLESLSIPLYDNCDSEEVAMTPDHLDSSYFSSESFTDIPSQSSLPLSGKQFSDSASETYSESGSSRKCLPGRQQRLGRQKANLQKSHAHPMKSKSEFFDDLIAEADEGSTNSSQDDAQEFADAFSEPRRMKKSLRDIKEDNRQEQNRKKEAIENVANRWLRGSSVDGFYFDVGDKVEFKERPARVLSRKKTGSKVSYEIRIDDTAEEMIAPESELVYGMIVSIRRRTLSRQSQASQSTQSSMSSSQFYQTCTDPSLLKPDQTTYHSFRSRSRLG